MKDIDLLKSELEIVTALFYYHKNEFKSSVFLNRLNDLRKKGKAFLLSRNETNRNKVVNACVNLYIAASANYTMGHFVKLSLIVFGVTGRIYTIAKYTNVFSNEIDEIFSEL